MSKRVVMYFLRWQVAGLILYTWTVPLFGTLWGTILGNTVGSVIFFYIDRYLTTKKSGGSYENSRH